MLAHVESEAPIEACGLLGGRDGKVNRVVPIANVANSPVRFRMEPAEQVRVQFEFEDHGLQLLGIFHSHPNGPSGPSGTDLREAAYPDAANLIWFWDRNEWKLRAYKYGTDSAREMEILVVD